MAVNVTELIYKTKEIKTKRLDNEKEVFLFKQDKNLQWIGLHSRYFLFLLKGSENFSDAKLNINKIGNEKNISLQSTLKINLIFPDLITNERYKNSFKLFVGTKTQSDLSAAGLKEILFQSSWSWMRYIILGIMSVLYWINNFVFNWGISIILLSILVRIIIHPIAKKSLKSQKEFSNIQKIINPK